MFAIKGFFPFKFFSSNFTVYGSIFVKNSPLICLLITAIIPEKFICLAKFYWKKVKLSNYIEFLYGLGSQSFHFGIFINWGMVEKPLNIWVSTYTLTLVCHGFDPSNCTRSEMMMLSTEFEMGRGGLLLKDTSHQKGGACHCHIHSFRSLWIPFSHMVWHKQGGWKMLWCPKI